MLKKSATQACENKKVSVSVPLDTLQNTTPITSKSSYPYSYRVQRYKKKASQPTHYQAFTLFVLISIKRICFSPTEGNMAISPKPTFDH